MHVALVHPEECQCFTVIYIFIANDSVDAYLASIFSLIFHPHSLHTFTWAHEWRENERGDEKTMKICVHYAVYDETNANIGIISISIWFEVPLRWCAFIRKGEKIETAPLNSFDRQSNTRSAFLLVYTTERMAYMLCDCASASALMHTHTFGWARLLFVFYLFLMASNLIPFFCCSIIHLWITSNAPLKQGLHAFYQTYNYFQAMVSFFKVVIKNQFNQISVMKTISNRTSNKSICHFCLIGRQCSHSQYYITLYSW